MITVHRIRVNGNATPNILPKRNGAYFKIISGVLFLHRYNNLF